MEQTTYRYLLSVYGIGQQKAKHICASIGASQTSKFSHLPSNKKDALNAILTKLKKTLPGLDTELKQNITTNITRLININTYRRKTT